MSQPGCCQLTEDSSAGSDYSCTVSALQYSAQPVQAAQKSNGTQISPDRSKLLHTDCPVSTAARWVSAGMYEMLLSNTLANVIWSALRKFVAGNRQT